MEKFFQTAVIIPLKNFLYQIYAFIPNLFAMLLILVIGFVLGWIVKKFLTRLLKLVKFDDMSNRLGFTNVLSKAGVHHSPAEIISGFLYWLIIFAFIMLGISALKVEALNNLISRFFFFIPNFIAGLVLFFLGYFISVIVERTILITAVNAEIQFAKFLSRGVQILVLVFFLAVAFEQIGIGRNVVVATFTILFGGIILALALALGLGGRDLAKDWLEKQLQQKSNKSRKKEIDEFSHL